MLLLCANIDKCDDTVPPLHIAMQCSQQIGWHAADNSTLTATSVCVCMCGIKTETRYKDREPTARQTNAIGRHKIKHRAEKQSHSQEDLPCRSGSICSLH